MGRELAVDAPPSGQPPEIIARIRAILAAGGVPEHRLDWMSRSCPMIARAVELVLEMSNEQLHVLEAARQRGVTAADELLATFAQATAELRAFRSRLGGPTC